MYYNGIFIEIDGKNSHYDENMLDRIYKKTNKKLESVDIDSKTFIW